MSTPPKCPGKEGFQRINYLYQIANRVVNENETLNRAGILYTNLLNQISKKTVQRIDVDFKRTICKFCKMILIPGVSCKVRVKKRKIIWTCLTCKKQKYFSTNDKVLWAHQNESIAETFNYARSISDNKNQL